MIRESIWEVLDINSDGENMIFLNVEDLNENEEKLYIYKHIIYIIIV